LLRRFPLLLIIILQGLTIAAVQAEEVGWRERPSHLSVIVGYTWEDGEEENTDAEMLGIDYEYRLSEFLGLGAVVEHAFDPLGATTALAVADLHVWRGLAIQTGPGVEFIDRRIERDGEQEKEEKELFVYRVGVLYEFEQGNLTISPQLHLDVTKDAESLIFGIAFGFAF
jgi:hypothetical protein